MATRAGTWEHVPLRRVPAQARSRDKVARALSAADRIVREEGVDSVNLPHVAELAGVSVGALYQYLPDREAILAALVWRYHARLEALLDEAIATARQHPPQGDPIDYMIDSVVQIYLEEESVRAMRGSADTPALTQVRRAHKERMAGKLADLLQAVGVSTTHENGSPEAIVAFIAADAVLHEAFARAAADRAALIEELRHLMRRYLAPPAGTLS
ncbi:MAG: TetR/AcrR family transcriptional regulator [Propionicimonas sp.]